MPLPDKSDTRWPPPPFDGVQDKYTEWAAWYSGEPSEIAGVYKGIPVASKYQYYGGVVGAVARFFWGQPPSKGSSQSSKLHVPVAEEIASEGSLQLFKNPPRIATDSVDHQERIDRYIEKGLFIKLLEAAEVACALSGVYIRVGFDDDISDIPLVSIIHPDSAVPAFYYDFLVGATAWRVIAEENGKIWRHLELHEDGMIFHGLYLGDNKTLGRRIPLTDRTETAELEEESEIPASVLDMIYVPNLKTRAWRTKGQASNLGRSDYGSVLSLMDALDEAYTSWMRDLRLGKARLIVPQQYLESAGQGKGASLDLDKEVFVELNVMASKDKMEITPNQFAIRFQEHAATCQALFERIISGCGYSAQTFGATGDVAMTATESNARERRTFDTRSSKIEIWERKVGELIRLMLEVDAQRGIVPAFPIDTELLVEFPPPVQESQKVLAEVAQLLRNAEAASTETLVRLIHPEWEDDRVDEEVASILDEAPDPEPSPILPEIIPNGGPVPAIPPVPVGGE
jgi:A118 family predicted phage portal protein